MTVLPDYTYQIITVIAFACFLLINEKSFVYLVLIFIYLLPRAGLDICFQVTFSEAKPMPYGFIMMGFLIVGWFLKNIRSPKNLRHPYKPGIAFFLYSIYAIMALLMGLSHYGQLHVIILEFVIYYVSLFVYFATVDMDIKKSGVKLFINGFILVSLLVSVYGIILRFAGPRFLIDGITFNDGGTIGQKDFFHFPIEWQLITARRTLSTYGDPNCLAAQIVVFIAIITALIVKEEKTPLHRKFYLFVCLITNFVCLYFTESRSGLISVLIVFILFALLGLRGFFFVSILAVGGFAFFSQTIAGFLKVHRLGRFGLTSPAAMLFQPSVFWRFISQYPLGAGFGGHINPDLTIRSTIHAFDGYNSTHLHILTKIGIFGFLVLIALFYGMFRHFIMNFNKIENTTVKAFVLGGTVGLIVQQLCFAINNLFMLPGGAFNYLIMCGIVALAISYFKNS